MAGPDVGTRPSKKKTIKKGTPSRHPGGMTIGKARVGGGVKWLKDRMVRSVKKDWPKVKKWWQQ